MTSLTDTAGVAEPPAAIPPPSLDKLLKPGDVASILGIPEHTVHEYRRTGRGPRWVQVGRHVRYRLADVEHFIAEHTRAPRGSGR